MLVRSPATSANLGPGFDSLGLALALYDDVEVQVAGGGLTIEVDGEGAEVADRGERHLIVKVLRRTFGVLDDLAGTGPSRRAGCGCAAATASRTAAVSARRPPRSSRGSSRHARCTPPGSSSATTPRCVSRPRSKGIPTTWRRASPAA